MLRVGGLFNRNANLQVDKHPTAPVPRKTKLYKALPWLAGGTLALAVPAVINAQQASPNSSNNVANVKAASTAETESSSPQTTAETKVEANTQSNNSSSKNSKSSVSTHVTVNGHHIDVPANGSVHTSVPDENGGNSKVDISVSNNSQGSSTNQSSSSSSVSIFSQSSNFSVNQESGE